MELTVFNVEDGPYNLRALLDAIDVQLRSGSYSGFEVRIGGPEDGRRTPLHYLTSPLASREYLYPPDFPGASSRKGFYHFHSVNLSGKVVEVRYLFWTTCQRCLGKKKDSIIFSVPANPGSPKPITDILCAPCKGSGMVAARDS